MARYSCGPTDQPQHLALLLGFYTLILGCTFLLGYLRGRRGLEVVERRAPTAAAQEQPQEISTMEYQVMKSHLMNRSYIDLIALCSRLGFSPGRATKETMAMAVLAEHDFKIDQLEEKPHIDKMIAYRGGRRWARG